MSLEPPSANQQIPIAEPLVEVRRGAITESRHRGHVTVVTPDGRIVSYAGDPANVTFLRSSAKPFQAIPLLVSGAADRFGFTDEEIALACASHNGEPIHTEIVAWMLEKIGLGPEALEVRRTRTIQRIKQRLIYERVENHRLRFTTTVPANMPACWL